MSLRSAVLSSAAALSPKAALPRIWKLMFWYALPISVSNVRLSVSVRTSVPETNVTPSTTARRSAPDAICEQAGP